MTSRKLFNNRKSNKKNIFFYLFILLFILICFFIFEKNNNEFIIISENKEKFYIIPKDKGGKKIANLDKKSLNLNLQQQLQTNTNNLAGDLSFSIQFYTNNDLKKVSAYLDKITNTKENIYFLENFYILSLNSDIGADYFLLYKNFETREAAKNYCLNFLNKIEKCLIVDMKKF